MKKIKTALLFPGQGSQFVGMGSELFDTYPEIERQADQVLGYSIRQLCLEDALAQLDLTAYTQPALYVVNALYYLEYIKDNAQPDFVAGHSLGEFNALNAAGVFDFGTGLKIVKERARLMYRQTGGTMAAVIGLNEAQVKMILEDDKFAEVDLANINTPQQMVISGAEAPIKSSEEIFLSKGAKSYIPLRVSGAFHSRFMTPLVKPFGHFLEEIEFKPCKVPVIANYTARPHCDQDIKKNLTMQLDHSVRWLESIQYLMGQSVDRFIQIGPGKTIDGMTRRIKRKAKPIVDSSYDQLIGAIKN